jgi:predicted lipid carrier protein YhbT
MRLTSIHLPSFPQPLQRLVSRMPQYPAAAAFAAALTLGIGESVNASRHPLLAGKRICVRVIDAGVTVTFTVTASGFFPAVAGGADVTFAATADDFLSLLLRHEDPDTLFFGRRLLIEGDTELGLYIKNTLDALEFKLRMPSPDTVRRLVVRALTLGRPGQRA